MRSSADEVSVRGSRFTEPAVVPVEHSWKVVCREPGLRGDEYNMAEDDTAEDDTAEDDTVEVDDAG